MNFNITEEQIDAQTNELLKEFAEHWTDCRALGPIEVNNERSTIFEGWALQKIASIQLLIIELVKQSQYIKK